jgi:copper homeostasis protein
MTILLEACVDSVASALAAEAGGADRLELAARMDLGGLTPPMALVAQVLACVRIPVVVLVRPRGGGFRCDPGEREAIRDAVDAARALGAHGVAVGALREDGSLDTDFLGNLVAAARPLRVTCHRAFDRTPDPLGALEELVALGFDRVLTSGGAADAPSGIEVLRALVRAAAGRIAVVGGGGVTVEAARRLMAAGVPEVHAYRALLGPAGVTDAGRVRELLGALGRSAQSRGSGPATPGTTE